MPQRPRTHPAPARGLPWAGLAVLALLLAGPTLARADWPFPFSPGEELVFALRWTAIPAGNATLAARPGRVPGGGAALHLTATARTNAVIDVFHKVRDRFDAFTEPDLSRSLLYLKDQREGSYIRNNTIVFDWNQTRALRYGSDRTLRDTPFIWPGTLDPLSILYEVRRRPLAEGYACSVPVSDGQKTVLGQARVLRREALTLVNGTAAEAFVVEPELKDLGGVFKKSPGARMFVWLSVEPGHLPLKLQSEVVVGSFTADLVRVRRVPSND